jgi:DNA ligase-1
LPAVGVLLLGNHVPARAEPVAAMLPQVYGEECNVAGWWVSEKLDGVRGFWDGRQLWSKNGKLLHPPPAFVQGLPDFPLEGELWSGRGTFEQTTATVRQPPDDAGWLRLQFAVFDVPQEPGGFSERIGKARAWFAAHPSPHAFVIAQSVVRDRAQLLQELQRVQGLGGEGLIVRNPQAPYTAGRSAEVLKVKEFQDAEAVVIAHLPGEGQNLGRLGALLVEGPGGVRFRIGTGFSAAERLDPPPPGAVVTYRHHGHYPSGIPRFPSFLRIRRDADL